MTGLGTIINVGAILLAGVLGSLFRRALKEKLQQTLMMACGVCVLFIGISGTLQQMLTLEQGKLVSGGSMMAIGCLVLGSLLGEWLDIELRLERFGRWLKVKTKSEKDASFVDAFVDTSLTVCIGAMAVVGAIQDGLSGDWALLAAKAVLDFVIVLVMTSARGRGCVFSAIPVALLQGGITLLARVISPVLTEQALANLSLTGSMLIFCVGINLIWGKKIRVANLLPALLIAVLWALLLP